MDFDFDIVRLSSAFYAAYPFAKCREILTKNHRSYNCLLVDTHYDFYICVPYRSNVSHKLAYKFKTSARSQKSPSGLDYTKMVLVKDSTYIESASAVVDWDEYRETLSNINDIVTGAVSYLEDYVSYHNGSRNIQPEEYRRRYSHSTLPYFNDILGISVEISEQ